MRSRRSCWVMERTSAPEKRTEPSVTSSRRSSILAMVDLPEPVEPMIAVVWPRRQEKSISGTVSSSASGKRKETWSNVATGTVSDREALKTPSSPAVAASSVTAASAATAGKIDIVQGVLVRIGEAE